MNHDRPRLPSRAPANRAIAATLRLWRFGECTAPATLARIAAGLRALPGHPQRTNSGKSTGNHEIGSSTGHLPELPAKPQHPPTSQDNR